MADTITGHAVIMARGLSADFGPRPNLSAYADRLEAGSREVRARIARFAKKTCTPFRA